VDLVDAIPESFISRAGHRGTTAIYHTRCDRPFRDARVSRIYGGSNEVMKVLIARTL
jgi:alkylation response protein AidB-like acyl-CoA dehydrogenase